MDCEKTGKLIRTLRLRAGLTQLQLAERLCVSDKAVSKWERGRGCPDVSLLSELSGLLGVELESLLSGSMDANDPVGGNMKKLKFYICPDCGNVITATAEAAVSCCGKKLTALTPEKAEGDERLTVTQPDGDYFITSNHSMTKESYISFVAFLNGETLIMRKLYPEWDMQVNLPLIGHGMLVWYCTGEGLKYQLV